MKKKFAPFCIDSTFIPVFSVLFILFLFFVNVSCSNSVPQLTEQKNVLVFDFSKTASAPSQRLCVFVRPLGQISRIRSITVENPSENLLWQLSPPRITSVSGVLWAGSSSLVMQNPAVFPEGEYRITVTDYNGTSAVSFFNLTYPVKLSTAAEKTVLQKENYPDLKKKYTILYGDASDILFFGHESIENTDPVQIKKKYPAAVLAQTYLESQSGAYAVLLPVRNIP